MPVFSDSEQLYNKLRALFQRIQGDYPDSIHAVATSRLIIRLRFSQPEAELTINGRSNPVMIYYGNSTLRPDLQVDLSADSFHQILLGVLPLGKAISSGQMKVKGPIYKTFILAEIFHIGQAIYPQLQ